MRKHPVSITIPRDTSLSNEDYDNDHRTKPVALGEWTHNLHLIQNNNSREGTQIAPVQFNNVEMNRVKVNIVSQMVQLIIKSSGDKPRLQKDMKQNLMLRRYKMCDEILPKNDKNVLNGVPDVVHNYIKGNKTKDGSIELDCMLYRHVKEIVSNYTPCFLCTEDSIDNNHVKIETCTDTIIGVMVIENNLNDKSKVNCIIHYMRILSK